MKIILDVAGIGVLGCDRYNFIVGDGLRPEGLDKSGKKVAVHLTGASFYSNLHDALVELYARFQKGSLGKGKIALSMTEFLEKVERTAKEWAKLTEGIIDRKITLSPPPEI